MGLRAGSLEVTDFLNVLLQGSSLSDVKEPNRLPAGSAMLYFIKMHLSNKQYVNLILPEKLTGCLRKYLTCCALYLMEF